MKSFLSFLLSIKVTDILIILVTFLITLAIFYIFPLRTNEVVKVEYKEKIVKVNTTDTVIITKRIIETGYKDNSENKSNNMLSGFYEETFQIGKEDTLKLMIKTFPACDSLDIEYFLDIKEKEIYIIDTIYVDNEIEKIKEVDFEPNLLQKPEYTVTAGFILGIIFYKYLLAE